MFKTALFDCTINEKCCSVDGGRGTHPTAGNLPSKAKKNLMPGGQSGGGGAQMELTDALLFHRANTRP